MGSKSTFNLFLLYGILPLFIAVISNKVSYLVAIDLAVWLGALIALFHLVKTPWEIYYLVKIKSLELEESHKRGRGGSSSSDNNHIISMQKEVAELELKMYYAACATPFASIIGWYVLSEFCGRYKLNSMTELIHPYFILLIAIASGLIPIQQFRQRMKKRITSFAITQRINFQPDHATTPLDKEVYELIQSTRRNQEEDEEVHKRLAADIESTNQTNRRLEVEMKSLRREVKAFAVKKNEEIQKLERKVIGLENQIELMQIMRKENLNEKGGRHLNKDL